jgi:hypothetical protein
MLSNRLQIKNSVLSTTQQTNAQSGSLVEDLINVTMQEIGDPSWAFQKERLHLWSWLKRKTTFTATSEDTVLERDVDKIALLRQVDSPTKITYVPDEIFYRELPDPSESGNPRLYRLWDIGGTSTKLSAADKIDIVSSSSSDTSTYEIVVTGYISGRLETEKYSCNGTSTVPGTKTWDAREIFISKSAITNGNITVTKNSGGSTLVVVGKEEVTPRFKVLSLYPTPSSNVIYMEYYKKIKELNNDSESPEFDPKWHHIVRLGTLAKVYEHLGKTVDAQTTNGWYSKMVRAMVASDEVNVDYVPYLGRRNGNPGINLHISQDTIS